MSTASAEELLRTWRTTLGTGDPECLSRRLAWDNLSQDEALAQLHALPCEQTRRVPFARISVWLQSSDAIQFSHAGHSSSSVPFQELWHLIALAAWRELAALLPCSIAAFYETRAEDKSISTAVRRDVVDDLTRKLSSAGEAVLWEAFNQCRTTAELIFAYVRSATEKAPARAIYCEFLEQVRASGLQTLTVQYPALETHLSILVSRWIQTSKDLLTRVHEDQELLRSTFRLPGDAIFSSVRLDLSDSHRGGQRVAVLSFTSLVKPQEEYSVVYKPKQMGLDWAFQDLLGRLNLEHAAADPLQTVAVLPRLGYGYMEYVPQRLCQDEAELCSFYKKAGRLAAVLYLLGCVDCHFENLIACGDQLILIDAETLLEGVPLEHRDFHTPPSHSNLQPRIDDSVLRIGLLPQWIFPGVHRTPIDVSALGTRPPAHQAEHAEGWLHLNTDAMFAGRVAECQVLPPSSPVGFGSQNRFGDFSETFCQAFENELLCVLDNRALWLEKDGLLSPFRDCTRRFISRPTWLYEWLRTEQSDTKYLRSAVAQRLLFENLARTYLLSQTKPATWPMFAAEVRQMEELDIPFFEQSVSSLNLELPTGATIQGFLKVSGYQHARNRVESLDRNEIDFEVRLIRGVVAARSRSTLRAKFEKEDLLSSNNPILTAQDCLAKAECIAANLLSSAISFPDGSAEWISINTEQDEEHSGYGPIGPALYNGQAGIALFLAAIARRSTPKSREYSRLAEAAIAKVIQFTTSASPDALGRWWRDQPLGIAGSGGILLSLVKLGQLIPRYRNPESTGIPRLLEALDPDFLRADRFVDIMSGCAGLIGSLLAIGSARARRLAEQAGDNLVRLQDSSGGWIIPSVGPIALTGFSHGASGIVAALARLYATTHLDRFAAAVAKGLHYERATFSSDRGNWPDFREPFDAESPRFAFAWCHGAPGVALSRLCLRSTTLFDAHCGLELESALRTTSTAFETGDSLCCGRPGCAAILRLGSTILRSKEWLKAASNLEACCLVSGRRMGNYSFIDDVGLFTGAAGLALTLLDSTAPQKERLLPHLLSAGLFR